MKTPIILSIGGHDPSGGAGIQADIETINNLGCRALTLVTALTRQDSQNVQAVNPVDIGLFSENLDCLIADIKPDVIKIGLLASIKIAELLTQHPSLQDTPVVLDPVLAAGGGKELGNKSLAEVIHDQLLPLCTLTTPNKAEARKLTHEANAESAAQAMSSKCAVLLTGADEAKDNTVVNRLYLPNGENKDFQWPLLPHTYHGSGCTLASACAAYLGHGLGITDAAAMAQRFTAVALQNAEHPGKGQHFPTRRNTHEL